MISLPFTHLRPSHLAAFLLALATIASGETVRVRMTDATPYYDPSEVAINVGDTVEWYNDGPSMVHVLTTADALFFSDDVKVGSTWTYTFNRPGLYPYVCFRHFFMKGTVVVRNTEGSTASAPEEPYHPAFREFLVPTRNAVPRMIIASKTDNTMWFTEGGGDFYGFEDIPPQNKLARIDDTGRIVEYATPAGDGDGSKVGVDSLVMDAQGNIWFTERIANRIGKLAPEGTISETPLPTPGGYALGIDLDSRGNLWFAERYGNRLGFLQPDGVIKEIELPEKDSEPRTVFVDSSDRVWYTAREANQIGYWDQAQARLIRLDIATKLARPAGVCETSSGALYFVEMVGNKLARVLKDQIIEYAIPTAFAAPFKCAVDADNNVWFTEVFGNAIARFDTRREEFTEYKIPTADSRPGGIAIDRRGRIWFTEQRGNKIGVFDPAMAAELLGGKAEARHKTLPGTQRAPAAAPSGALNTAAGSTATEVAEDKGGESDQRATGVLGGPPNIHDFQVPTPGAGPGNDLIDAGTGRLWFPEVYAGKIGSLEIATGTFSEITLKTPVSMPVGIALDRDGQLWATLFRANGLARVDTTSGSVDEYFLSTAGALPTGITIDEAGGVWFAQMGSNRIARFDRNTLRFEEFALPTPDSGPLQIVADGRGALWITASDEAGNALVRFDIATHSFRSYGLPTSNAGPTGILLDSDAIWVAEGEAGKLARFDRGQERWEEFALPGDRAEPVKLARDKSGRIWITDGGGLGSSGGNRLLVFDPRSRTFGSIAMAKRGAKPMGITLAADGHLWFTQQGINRVSKLTLEASGQ